MLSVLLLVNDPELDSGAGGGPSIDQEVLIDNAPNCSCPGKGAMSMVSKAGLVR